MAQTKVGVERLCPAACSLGWPHVCSQCLEMFPQPTQPGSWILSGWCVQPAKVTPSPNYPANTAAEPQPKLISETSHLTLDPQRRRARWRAMAFRWKLVPIYEEGCLFLNSARHLLNQAQGRFSPGECICNHSYCVTDTGWSLHACCVYARLCSCEKKKECL